MVELSYSLHLGNDKKNLKRQGKQQNLINQEQLHLIIIQYKIFNNYQK